MKFRKHLVTLTAITLSATLLAACGGKPIGESPSPTSSSGEETGEGATGKALLADARFRQAVKLAIDMQSIIDGTMQGKADVANVLMSPGPFKPDSGLEDWSYDPERAKELLAEIGWDSATVLDVVYYYGDPATVDLMAAIQQYLSEVGIKITPRKLEGDLGTQLWTAPQDRANGPSAVDWDMAYGAVAALSPHEYYDRFSESYPGNSYWPTNLEFQGLIDATAATADPVVQTQAFHEVIKWESANLPAVPLYYQPIFIAQSDRLDRAGAEYGNEQYNYDWNIVNWEIDPDSSGAKIMRTNGGAVDFFETPFLNPGLHLSTKVLYDHLIVTDGQMSAYSPQLASQYNVSEDGLTIDFTLRDGLKWHDGTDLTAQDVKFTYELAAKIPNIHSVFDATLGNLVGATEYRDGSAEEISGIAIDGNKVTFTFAELDPNALLTFSQLPPLPQAALANADPLQIQQAPFFQSPIGSGPFAIKDVKMGDYTIFSAFADYWAGTPKIEEVHMYPSGESDPNLVKNVQAGAVDYAYSKSIEDAIAIEAVSSMEVETVDVKYTRLLFINSFPRK